MIGVLASTTPADPGARLSLLGAAWTVATYFVVPVLVVENLGPLDAARRSAAIVKKGAG